MKKIVGILITLFLVIITAGIIKFNIIQDDIFYDGSYLNSEEISLFHGSWTKKISGIGGREGFILHKNGKAESINMSTLQYSTWTYRDGFLILEAKSIGNKMEFDFKDKYKVESLNKDQLYLQKDKRYFIYKKK